MDTEFHEFPKITRFYEQDVCITEKIDGTNGLIYIGEEADGSGNLSLVMKIGSRSRWITPEDDNYGFARWCKENQEELWHLGLGYHYGEWWGNGIQRKYAMAKKVFSLFNVHKWRANPDRPACCNVVPTLYVGPMTPEVVNTFSKPLERSVAALEYGIEFTNPEGYMMYFTKAGKYFKCPTEKGAKG